MNASAHRVAAPRGERQGGEVAEMQRRRLLFAFGEIVAESGLEAAVVGRICQRAAVSRRTFYELFSDREDCLVAAFDQAVAWLADMVAPDYAGQGHWRERIRAALALLLRQFDAEPDVARLCVIEAPRAGPVLLERRRRVLDALARAVDEGRLEARAGSEPLPLTAQGVVGGVLAVIHARLLEGASPATGSGRAKGASGGAGPLVELTGPLMAMIVHPYLGPLAARKELKRPVPAPTRVATRNSADPFKGLPIRFTYRTACVLATIAEDPGASNRHIADSAGIADEGQMSRLLRRLEGCELIVNRGGGHTRGEPNAWALTERGRAIQAAITIQTSAA